MSHVDCKSVNFEALESVVKDVTQERGGRGRVVKEEDEKDGKLEGGRKAKTENDSSLKEGIRRWLTEVE